MGFSADVERKRLLLHTQEVSSTKLQYLDLRSKSLYRDLATTHRTPNLTAYPTPTQG